MSEFVLDASVTMAWCFEDEGTPETESLLDELAVRGAVVPQLWLQEVANVLLVAERKSRVSEAIGARFTSLLGQLPIKVAAEAPSSATLVSIGRSHGLSAYDATYLWLAESRALPLATLDDSLRAACATAGVVSLP
ncbi:MAG: type II toxin-antitoxin system VapC family toxin [Marmoricola sp.]